MTATIDSPVRQTSRRAGSPPLVELCDVFVLGGGPAGSTIAALLRERGWDVVIVEKERHPRFHIGESLLPLNVMLLEKLGIRERIDEIGLYKYGAEFTSPQHQAPGYIRLRLRLGQVVYVFLTTYAVRSSTDTVPKVASKKARRGSQECRVTNVEIRAGGRAHLSARQRRQ